MPEMTVAENIMLGTFPTRKGMIRSGELEKHAGDALREIGVDIDLHEPVSRLSVSLRQFIEIARAVARKPRVLILDEPTATLTPAETDYLLQMLRRLADGGLSIVYISHRLPEIFAICERVTVLRDGRHIDTLDIADTTPDGLVDKMVGRELKRDLGVVRKSNPARSSSRRAASPRRRSRASTSTSERARSWGSVAWSAPDAASSSGRCSVSTCAPAARSASPSTAGPAGSAASSPPCATGSRSSRRSDATTAWP